MDEDGIKKNSAATGDEVTRRGFRQFDEQEKDGTGAGVPAIVARLNQRTVPFVGASMERRCIHTARLCADFIVSTPDYFVTQQMNSSRQNRSRDRSKHKGQSFGTGYADEKTRISVDDGGCCTAGLCSSSSAKQFGTGLSRLGTGSNMVMGKDVRNSDSSLFDSCSVRQIFLPCWSRTTTYHLRFLDDMLICVQKYTQGGAITTTYADDVDIDSRTGNFGHQRYTEEYLQENRIEPEM